MGKKQMYEKNNLIYAGERGNRCNIRGVVNRIISAARTDLEYGF